MGGATVSAEGSRLRHRAGGSMDITWINVDAFFVSALGAKANYYKCRVSIVHTELRGRVELVVNCRVGGKL